MQLFTATWLSYAGFYFARKVYAVVKHPLKDQFGFDDVQVAWPWTIYLITYMVGQFVEVWLGRRMESRRVLAWGRLAENGPGIFGPNHGAAAEIAGHGVADPSSMLLAAALMLEGLGERGAGATLSSAVSHVIGNGTARAVGTVSMTSELTDAVLAQLPQSHSNAEVL